MKGLFRAPWVQATLAFLMAGWMRFCFATTRWTHENEAAAEAVWAGKTGAVLCFWHSRIGLSPHCWPLSKGQPARAMISLSPDGEFIAGAVAHLGYPSIRGSSTKKTRKGFKQKGGAEAFRDVLRWVRGGGCIAITPDGPRGPARQMAEGALLLAKMSKAPVLMVGLSCKPAITLNSWDKAIIPLPFAKGAVVWHDAFSFDGDDTQSQRELWAKRLDAVTDRADALTA